DPTAERTASEMRLHLRLLGLRAAAARQALSAEVDELQPAPAARQRPALLPATRRPPYRTVDRGHRDALRLDVEDSRAGPLRLWLRLRLLTYRRRGSEA